MRILLLPWFNYNKNHLAKYHKMYKKMGFNDIEIIDYSVKELTSFKKWINIRENIKVKNYNFIHCFSGGSLFYYNMKKCGVFSDKVLYDSGPMFPTVDCISNYVNNYYFKSNNKIIDKTLYFTFNSYYDLENLILPGPNLKEESKDYEKIIFDNNSKYLIINNVNDKLVQLSKIKNVLNNENVENIIFNNSKHVQHLKYNEEKYINSIEFFLNKN